MQACQIKVNNEAIFMISPPEVFLIHGWAANHHIFDALRLLLAIDPDRWHTPDLPGHGAAAPQPYFDLNAIADQFAAGISRPVHLVGWSLGGMVALVMAARHPDKVKSLCLTASLAKLHASADYPQGLQHVALEAMIPRFEQNYYKSMRQFLGLQMLYAAPEDRLSEQQLLPALCQYGAPTGLTAALTALQQLDLRPILTDIHCPVLLIFGGRDAITPMRMGEYLHQNIRNSHWLPIPEAAHAPFLSHGHQFAPALKNFWESQP